MRSAFIFILGVSAAILFIIGLNLIVVPLVLGPASGNYMVDKADCLKLNNGRQAGANDLETYFPELKIPHGLTWEDLEVAEQMIFDWEEKPDSHRAFGLVLRVFERLMMAVLAARKDPSRAS
jgi:hypothetical protein